MLHPLAVGADHVFAILFGESAELRLAQDVKHKFRGAAQAHTERRRYEGTVDEYRMGQHGVE